MVDNFSLAVAHALIALAIWLLVRRDDLDVEPPVEVPDRDA